MVCRNRIFASPLGTSQTAQGIQVEEISGKCGRGQGGVNQTASSDDQYDWESLNGRAALCDPNNPAAGWCPDYVVPPDPWWYAYYTPWYHRAV
jgi:hypothetical protein